MLSRHSNTCMHCLRDGRLPRPRERAEHSLRLQCCGVGHAGGMYASAGTFLGRGGASVNQGRMWGCWKDPFLTRIFTFRERYTAGRQAACSSPLQFACLEGRGIVRWGVGVSVLVRLRLKDKPRHVAIIVINSNYSNYSNLIQQCLFPLRFLPRTRRY